MYAVPSGERNVETAPPQEVVSRRRVEDEVLRQAAWAVEVEAELLAEVRRHVGVLPPVDRHREDLDGAEHRNGCSSREDEVTERRKDERAAQEVRGDAGAGMPEPVEDRLGVGLAAEPVLREHRVEKDEAREDDRERVDEPGAERQRSRGERIPRHPRQRDREQHFLPRGDQRERRPLDADGEEARHDRVVEGEPDHERVDRVDGPPPDGKPARRQRPGVDDERESRHGG